MDIENAELCMHKCFDEVDFTAKPSVANGIADDMAFIMENYSLCEPENSNFQLPEISLSSSSEDSSESSDDQVQIIEHKANNVTIVCSDSDTDEETKMKLSFKDETGIVSQLLSDLIQSIDERLKIKSNVDGDDSDYDENDRERLAAIICEEEKIHPVVPKVANEVLIEELPEVEIEEVIKLSNEDTLMYVGCVSSVIEKIIVVEGDQSAPALDADSAFFLDQDTYLGKVFDTFGPVKHPYYSVRVSTNTDIPRLSKNTKVFFVPFNKQLTKYVFVDQLTKLKGSDASWANDIEPPVECLDYSDEEEEREAKKKLKLERERKRVQDSSDNRGKQATASTASRKRLASKLSGSNPLLEHACQHQPFQQQQLVSQPYVSNQPKNRVLLSTPCSSEQSNSTNHGAARQPFQSVSTNHGTAQKPFQNVLTNHGVFQQSFTNSSTNRGAVQQPFQNVSTNRGAVQQPLQNVSTNRGAVQQPLQNVSTNRGAVQQPFQNVSTYHGATQQSFNNVSTNHSAAPQPFQNVSTNHSAAPQPFHNVSTIHNAAPQSFTNRITSNFSVRDTFQKSHSNYALQIPTNLQQQYPFYQQQSQYQYQPRFQTTQHPPRFESKQYSPQFQYGHYQPRYASKQYQSRFQPVQHQFQSDQYHPRFQSGQNMPRFQAGQNEPIQFQTEPAYQNMHFQALRSQYEDTPRFQTAAPRFQNVAQSNRINQSGYAK